MRRSFLSLLAVFGLAAIPANAAVPTFYPPAVPTTALPAFIVNPATGSATAAVPSVATSTLTRPANVTAYAGSSSSPVLIASSTVAGSIVVPSFSTGTSLAVIVPRITLSTNVTTGWNGVSLTVTLWTSAPTYTNGDGGAYAVATGAASQRIQYNCTLTQMGDGAVCEANSVGGSFPLIQPASGTVIYWDVQIAGAATPISGQTFTLTPEIFN